MLEILLGKKPNEYVKKSVWAENSRYFIDGKSIALPSKLFKETETTKITKKINQYKGENTYEYFDEYIDNFKNANKERLNGLIDEAQSFVKNASKKYDEEHIVLSFSGGKDSTVTADVVIKALSNPSLVHIFGNTTLEFPTTI